MNEPDRTVYTEYSLMSPAEAAREMKELKQQIDDLAKRKTELQKRYDFIRTVKIPEEFENLEQTTATYPDVGRVILQSDMFVSIKGTKKEDAYQWLIRNEHGELITETVNASSLKALARTLLKKGESLPEEFFNVTPYTRAVIQSV